MLDVSFDISSFPNEQGYATRRIGNYERTPEPDTGLIVRHAFEDEISEVNHPNNEAGFQQKSMILSDHAQISENTVRYGTCDYRKYIQNSLQLISYLRLAGEVTQ